MARMPYYSERVLSADLQPARIRLAEVAGVRIEGVEVSEILEVEHIEHIHRDRYPRARHPREILAEADVDVTECPRVGNDEAVLGRREAPELRRRIAGRVEEVADVVLQPAAERDQPAELDPGDIGQVENPVGDDVTALIVPRLLRIE